MKSFFDVENMSEESIDALFDLADQGMGVCEIESVMYCHMLENGSTHAQALSFTERIVNFLHSKQIYYMQDLIRSRPYEFLEEKAIGQKTLTYIAYALMNMHKKKQCEEVFKDHIYAAI
jgi:DNA-directed RNA polymerase alpha subunit